MDISGLVVTDNMTLSPVKLGHIRSNRMKGVIRFLSVSPRDDVTSMRIMLGRSARSTQRMDDDLGS